MTPSEIIFSVQESPEGGYHARALGFSIFTEADSLAELEAMIRDAVSCRVPQTSVLRLGLSVLTCQLTVPDFSTPENNRHRSSQ